MCQKYNDATYQTVMQDGLGNTREKPAICKDPKKNRQLTDQPYQRLCDVAANVRIFGHCHSASLIIYDESETKEACCVLVL